MQNANHPNGLIIRITGFHGFWACASRALVVVACLTSFGCALGYATRLDAVSDRPVKTQPIEVFRQSSLDQYSGASIGIIPPHLSGSAVAAGDEITHIYQQELLQLGAFKQVKTFAHRTNNDEEAIWWARQEGCDLVMGTDVIYLLDGSGAMPTHLHVGVRILDARSGNVSWDLLQKAYSEPGRDVDLFWTTTAGAPAQRYPLLARALAEQLSSYLADPLSYRRKEKKQKRWVFF